MLQVRSPCTSTSTPGVFRAPRRRQNMLRQRLVASESVQKLSTDFPPPRTHHPIAVAAFPWQLKTIGEIRPSAADDDGGRASPPFKLRDGTSTDRISLGCRRPCPRPARPFAQSARPSAGQAMYGDMPRKHARHLRCRPVTAAGKSMPDASRYGRSFAHGTNESGWTHVRKGRRMQVIPAAAHFRLEAPAVRESLAQESVAVRANRATICLPGCGWWQGGGKANDDRRQAGYVIAGC